MSSDESKWTFFSNHGHVYFLIAKTEGITVREISQKVGITERSIQGIINDLDSANYIKREKVGRANVYKIVPKTTLRHNLEKDVLLSDLTKLILNPKK